MNVFLDFNNSSCKDCYKCLRACPVKAINFMGKTAHVDESRCTLCGVCTLVCPQNTKQIVSELSEVKALLKGDAPVVASVAPSFVSSFDLMDFSIMKIALCKLGFADAEETSVGAWSVTEQYRKLMETGQYKNFITSACPSANRMIQYYYPKALKYLAPVDSPMVAHAKIIKNQHPEAKVVFVGPCIAKKREARETGVVDAVLTFEELSGFFEERNVNLEEINVFRNATSRNEQNLSKAYPISHGVIQSFGKQLPAGYEYMAVDGVDRCTEVLENIEKLEGVFIELNSCQDSCVNGPCSITQKGDSIISTAKIRKYVKDEYNKPVAPLQVPQDVNLDCEHKHIRHFSMPPSEEAIAEIMAKTGKYKPEDQLNCGACGFNTCREKALAVYYGYADLEMCVPYMKERAEMVSNEIIQNTLDGVVVLDSDMNIVDINDQAREIFGMNERVGKGSPVEPFVNTEDFVKVLESKQPLEKEKVLLEGTERYVNMSICFLPGSECLCGTFKEVTNKVNYEEKLKAMKLKTLDTTDEVIKKQMRVAQEIASLLGETTAETKIALLNLKKTLQEE